MSWLTRSSASPSLSSKKSTILILPFDSRYRPRPATYRGRPHMRRPARGATTHSRSGDLRKDFSEEHLAGIGAINSPRRSQSRGASGLRGRGGEEKDIGPACSRARCETANVHGLDGDPFPERRERVYAVEVGQRLIGPQAGGHRQASALEAPERSDRRGFGCHRRTEALPTGGLRSSERPSGPVCRASRRTGPRSPARAADWTIRAVSLPRPRASLAESGWGSAESAGRLQDGEDRG